jgi:hypothetical protein
VAQQADTAPFPALAHRSGDRLHDEKTFVAELLDSDVTPSLRGVTSRDLTQSNLQRCEFCSGGYPTLLMPFVGVKKSGATPYAVSFTRTLSAVGPVWPQGFDVKLACSWNVVGSSTISLRLQCTK